MEFRILGPVEVVEHQRRLPLGGPKQRALLAVLVLHANEVVSTGRLADLLWGDAPPADPGAAVQVYVSNLRKVLEPDRAAASIPQVLLTRRPGYLLRVERDRVDALRFADLVVDARRALGARAPAEGAEVLRQALGLWRGRALADVAHHPFADAHVARLEEARLAALEDLYEAELGLGHQGDVVGELKALVAEHPLRERPRGQLMVALYRSGRQAEALAAYQEGRKVLVEALGIDPGPALRELEHAILEQDPALSATSPPPGTPDGSSPPAAPARSSASPTSFTSSRSGLALPAALRVPHELRFCGRTAELDLLARAWRRSEEGDRQLVLVSGEAGVGKTRLVHEAARAAHAAGARVLYGRCDPELGVAYQPFIDALGDYLGGCDEAELRAQLADWGGELARIIPGLARRGSQVGPPPAADAETERYRLFQAVAHLLARASSVAPVVLVLEDLHWATKPTVLLFRHLVTSVEPMAALVVATHRPADVSPMHPLSEVLADLRRERGVARIVLSGLGEAEVASLIEHTAGPRLGDAVTLARALRRETDGNAFFVTEILRHLIESGIVADEEGQSAAGLEAGRFDLPESVLVVIGHRLARLSERVNRALPVAAVVGEEFDLGLASRVNELSEDEMLDVLEEASAAALVTEVPGRLGRFRFSHALIRHALYDALGPTRRAHLHRRVAEAIEGSGADLDASLPALAHHWFSAGPAGDIERAVGHLRRAGRKAMAEVAYEEAADYLGRALALLDWDIGDDDLLRCDLLLMLGDAQRRAGDTRHRSTMLEAARLSRGLGDGERLARAALGASRAHAWFGEVGRVDEALLALYEEALAALGPGDSVLRASLQSQLAVELYWTTARERRRALCESATAMARRLADPSGLALVLVARIVANWDPTTLEERLALTAELLGLAADLDNPELTFRGRLCLGVCLSEAGEVARARTELATAARLARELRQPLWSWFTQTVEAMQLLLTGSGEAEQAIFAAFELGQRCGQPDAHLLMAVQLCVFWWDQGRTGDVIAFLEPYVNQMPAIPAFRVALAFAYCDAGRTEDARRHIDLLATEGLDLPLDWAWSTGMTMLTETCIFLGDSARAHTLYDLLLPFADQLVVVGVGQFCLGSVSRSLAMLAAALQRWSDAERHFRHALSVNRRIGAPTFVVRTQRAYAAMLLDRNDPGDGARAAELARQALEVATERRMGLEVERLSGIVARAGRPPAEGALRPPG